MKLNKNQRLITELTENQKKFIDGKMLLVFYLDEIKKPIKDKNLTIGGLDGVYLPSISLIYPNVYGPGSRLIISRDIK